MLALPTAPYALAEWKRVKLHPDCHVVFNSSFYSAPFRLIGQVLWLRAAETSVQVFHAHELVASHTRATRPGQRRTHPDHLPPAKVATLQATPAYCLRRAREIVSPVLLGTGKRFFAEGTPARSLVLVSTGATPSGVVLSTYQLGGALKIG